MTRYCLVCEHELESNTGGGSCPRCGTKHDIYGRIVRYVKSANQTTIQAIQESLGSRPAFSSADELFDDLEKPKEEK